MQNADSADVFVVLLGYILMHGSFVQLFMNMRKLGSSFWLGECGVDGQSVADEAKPYRCVLFVGW